MNVWNVRFLGMPRLARQDIEEYGIQAQEAWAVLASLLLPPRLSLLPFPERIHKVSRQSLADRFWTGKEDPRVYLRQSLAFLRKTFGEECFISDRETIAAIPYRFDTDIGRMLTLFREAGKTTSVSERIQLLTQVEADISGEFLAGFNPSTESAQIWLMNRRFEARNSIILMLEEFTRTLDAAGQHAAALSIVNRLLSIDPENIKVQTLLWQLSDKTGQIYIKDTIRREEGIRTALEKIGERGEEEWTISDRRHFNSLLEREIAALPHKWRKPFLRLSLLPQWFTPEIAQKVCRVPPHLLPLLARTQLVRAVPEGYVLPTAVRNAAWLRVPTTTRRQLQKRFVALCMQWIEALGTTDPNMPPPPFATMLAATKFLETALIWATRQAPDDRIVCFLANLQNMGIGRDSNEPLSYFKMCYDWSEASVQLRYNAALYLADSYRLRGHFTDAVYWYRQTLATEPFDDLSNDTVARVNNMLAVVLHYDGDSLVAKEYLYDAIAYYRTNSDKPTFLAACLRFLCEIQNHTGEFVEALTNGEESVNLRRKLFPKSPTLADALFWKGATLIKLDRLDAAHACLEEALSLWQESGDQTGMGHCLRLIGKIRCLTGQFAEGKAHLQHAILLHESTGNLACRIAALEVLADAHLVNNYFAKAKDGYEECLAFYQQQTKHSQHPRTLLDKIRQCIDHI